MSTVLTKKPVDALPTCPRPPVWINRLFHYQNERTAGKNVQRSHPHANTSLLPILTLSHPLTAWSKHAYIIAWHEL